MTEEQAQKDVRQVENLRRQNALWRTCSTIAIIAIFGIGLGNIVSMGRSLMTPGPRQELFTNELMGGLQRDVVPVLQQIAGRTLTETRPRIEEEFAKIGQRTPELTEAATKELQTLQTNLEARGGKVVEATLVPMLERRESKIKEMFPEVTDENIKTMVTTLGDEMTTRAASAHDTLFSKHVAAINGIVTDMETIRLSEKVTPGTEQANWELGLDVFDVIREDLRELEPKPGAKTPPGPAAKPGTKSAAASSAKIQIAQEARP